MTEPGFSIFDEIAEVLVSAFGLDTPSEAEASTPEPEEPVGKPKRKPRESLHMGTLGPQLKAQRYVKNVNRERRRRSGFGGARLGCYQLAGPGGCKHPQHRQPGRKVKT